MLAEFWDCLRLDPAPVQELRARYEQHLRDEGRPEVIVDLSGVGFAGSAALGSFVALHRIARQNGGRVIFCRLEATVATAFRASKLDKLFDFVADRDAAIDAAKRGSRAARPAAEADPTRPRSSPPLSTGLNRLRRQRPTTDPQ